MRESQRGPYLLAGAAILAAIGLTGTQATEPSMTPAVHVKSAYSFAETVQRLRDALEAKGFTLFCQIDQREAARSVGLDMPPTTLILYGNPKGGTPLMLAAPDFGLELPLKLLVRELSDGKALVVYNPAIALEGRHGLPVGLADKLGAAEPLIASAVGAHGAGPN